MARKGKEMLRNRNFVVKHEYSEWKEEMVRELSRRMKGVSEAALRLVVEKIPLASVEKNGYFELEVYQRKELDQTEAELELHDTFWSNDWRFYDFEEIVESGQILLGEAMFGKYFLRKYFENGEMISEEKKIQKAQFNPDKSVIALIKRKSEKTEDGEIEEDTTYHLFLYIPKE